LTTLLGGDWTISNKGINGNTTTQMLARFNDDVLAQSPGYIIIWGGSNDIATDVSASTIENNLSAMYSASKLAGLKVIAVNIMPHKGDGTGWTEAKQAVMDSVNSWMNAVPDNVDWVIDTYGLVEDPENDYQILPAYDSGDHIHLNESGYDAIANLIHNEVGDF
jgi:lysophospholipase L1-like esterase